MKIGGPFKGKFPFARHDIEHLFLHLHPDKVFVPDYICKEIVNAIPCKKEYYHINDNLKADPPKKGLLYVIDYFGKTDEKLLNTKSIVVRDITHNPFIKVEGYVIASLRKWGLHEGQDPTKILDQRKINRDTFLKYLRYKLDFINEDSLFNLTVRFENKEKRDYIRQSLAEKKIYLPVLWPCKNPLSEKVLSFIIDQRYDTQDIIREVVELNKIFDGAVQLFYEPRSCMGI